MNREEMKQNAESFRKRKERSAPKPKGLVFQTPQEQPMGQQKEYKFKVPGPNGQPGILPIPHHMMSVCPCGCDLFKQACRIAYVKPADLVGAEVVRLTYVVYLCVKCDREIEPGETHGSVEAEKAQADAAGNGMGILTDVQG